MSINEKNATYLYVGNVASGVADGGAIGGIASGSVAVCTMDGKVEKGAATSGKYRIAQKLSDGTLLFGPVFDMAQVKNIVGKSYVAPTQQTTYLGYNGSTGSLTVAADADYVLAIEWKNTAGIYSNKAMLLDGAYHTTAASQAELSIGLLLSLDAMLKRQPYKFVKIDRINNAAVTVGNLLDHNAIVVNGLNAITVATNLTYAVTTGTLAVGDYLRIGTVGLGTALTSPVYRITAINGLVVTLDRPVTVPSDTYATATADIEVIPVLGANFGLKFVGQENSKFNAVNDSWSLTRFDLLSSDFATTDITYSTAANEGSGYYKQVANQEVHAQFLDKAMAISAYPQTQYRSETSSAKTYDMISFEINEPVFTSNATGLSYNKTVTINIALDVALTGDDVDTVFGVTV